MTPLRMELRLVEPVWGLLGEGEEGALQGHSSIENFILCPKLPAARQSRRPLTNKNCLNGA